MEVIITGPTSGDPKTCEYILRSVPEWFGIEKAIVEYTRAVESLPTFYAKNENETIGLLSTKFHYPNSAEIYLMAIHREWHRKGIGKQLLEATEEWLINTGVNVLQVKTLGESRESVEYERTRKFYEKMGFLKIEEFHDFWCEGNPCLLMVKYLIRQSLTSR